MKKAALLSVSDKSGIEDIAKALQESGFTLLSTSGTLKKLRDSGLEVTSIADYTGQSEILDGRVKTLHPKIHAGLLARRDDPAHMEELEKSEIIPIDVAVINLYPFIQKLEEKGPDAKLTDMVEFIDIGGPTMLRSAAKNVGGVTAIVDPSDYEAVIADIREHGTVREDLRLKLSEKVFRTLADYNLQIAKYLSAKTGSNSTDGVVLKKQEELRYGENPHQSAGFFTPVTGGGETWKQLGGKALSYNNLLDLDAALKIIRAFTKDSLPTIALLKHLNPCGLAQAGSSVDALKLAQKCDARSHFGGIVAVSTCVDLALAEQIAECFYEVVVAPAFADDALDRLRAKKALRLIQFSTDDKAEAAAKAPELRSIESGALIQELDTIPVELTEEMVVTKRKPTDKELDELKFAWLACRFVKSNAIVISKGKQLIGVGAGQMSRVDSSELALNRAKFHGHDLHGAVAASDAFFPFPDAMELLAEAGVTAIVAPGGAKRDKDVIAAADAQGIVLVFAKSRHFRH